MSYVITSTTLVIQDGAAPYDRDFHVESGDFLALAATVISAYTDKALASGDPDAALLQQLQRDLAAVHTTHRLVPRA